MEVAVSRSHVAQPPTWLRDAVELFMLAIAVRFSHEECWVIDTYNLYHHVVFDRTPPWYFSARREAERARDRAERDGNAFEWPWYVPPSVPPEWIVTPARLIEHPVFDVWFRSAAELSVFEPRLWGAFANFKRFLSGYGARPDLVTWRL